MPPRTCRHAACGRLLTDKRADALWCSDACRVAALRAREAVQSPNTPQGLTQTQRVLRALRARGEHGLTAVDFAAPHVLDGGKPIMRVAARILDLRRRGFRIISSGRRNECEIYVLVSEPAASHEFLPRIEPVEDDAGELHLFDHREPATSPYATQDIAA